jgi:hypothetical protein
VVQSSVPSSEAAKLIIGEVGWLPCPQYKPCGDSGDCGQNVGHCTMLPGRLNAVLGVSIGGVEGSTPHALLDGRVGVAAVAGRLATAGYFTCGTNGPISPAGPLPPLVYSAVLKGTDCPEQPKFAMFGNVSRSTSWRFWLVEKQVSPAGQLPPGARNWLRSRTV